jgi:hypothetical protein
VKELVSEFERKLETETGLRTRLDDGNTDTKAKGHEERRQLEEDIGTYEVERDMNRYISKEIYVYILTYIYIYTYI